MHVQGEPRWVTLPGGRRLFAMVCPGPTPAPATVVFEAGSGATRSTWGLVQPAVGTFARAVAYDRAGLGRSDPDPRGPTLRRMGEDLAALLDTSGEGPYVLVGHSAGGPIVRLAASLRPALVRGLVLVDPADEGASFYFSRAFRRGERGWLTLAAGLSRVGLLRVLFARQAARLPADAREDWEREGFTPALVRAQAAGARTYLDDLATWRTDPPDLGALPVTVVAAGRAGGMPRRYRAEANAAYAARAAASPAGRVVVAEHSGHGVPFTEPTLIVEEVRRLVGQLA